MESLDDYASPDGEIEKSEWYSAMILIVLMVMAIAMAFIMLIGSLRKRTSSGFFKWTLWATVLITPMLISYGVGQMTSAPYEAKIIQYALLPIWGILLLAWLGSYGTISAFQLADNETALGAYYQGVVKCGLVFFMVLFNAIDLEIPLLWVLLLLTPCMFPRVSKRARAMAYASKNNLFDGVGKKVEIVADFMEWDVNKNREQLESGSDAETMHGYRYLVGLKKLWKNKKFERSPPSYHRDFTNETEDVVTTQEIWQCQGKLLRSSGWDSDGKLKDTCLSFALFWMLLRRYTCHRLPEVASQKEKTWRFVRDGLIPEVSEATSERTFRVIEQEISFAYDYFYTKNFVTYLYGFPSIIFQFIVIGAYIVIAQLILNDYKEAERLNISNYVPPFRVDVLITKIVIFVMCVLELALIIHYVFITPWSKVGWVCTYVRKQRSNKSWKNKCQLWVIEKTCGVSLFRNIKHWKRELGQYSFLRHHDYVSCTRFFNCCLKIIPIKFLDTSKKGRKSSKSISFSIDLKKAMLSSLHKNGSNLTNGISALRKHKVETELSWACNLETQAETILVWHIATGYCVLNHHKQDPDHAKNNDYFLLATQLSEYCAYLVGFKPQLLPDQTNTTVNIFDSLIEEAKQFFKECSNMDEKYVKMKKIVPGEFKGEHDKILKKGICLGRSLEEKLNIEPLSSMLEEFWAELLLYLAPSEDVEAHLKELASGGEVITHLWALLTHAGILTRELAPPTSVSP